MKTRLAINLAAVLFASLSLPPAAFAQNKPAPLLGDYVDRTLLPNPYAHIPAQCYIETANGAQNACQYCHTDGVYKRGLGNNSPQAGASIKLGNLQKEYAFAAIRHPFSPNGSDNPWTNTLHPEKLKAALDALNVDPARWDMTAWVAADNWTPAYAKRPGDPKSWDAGVQHPFRLFPGLDPADLPASPEDGFVRSAKPANGFFRDGQGYVTGWRAVNFFPYGIFTPLTGSVSGIYIRLPEIFMKNQMEKFDLSVYEANLDLVARAVQDRLGKGEKRFKGAASKIAVERGLYPEGTEFAHPLHYVDVRADGGNAQISPFPGTRARRVKEIRYMYKIRDWRPEYGGPQYKEEDGPIYGHHEQGWADNGAGWILSGFIEDKSGELRPQTLSELAQCVGCHSGNFKPSEKGYGNFNSGTGNTIDSSWALPRAYPGKLGWREMDYLGYKADAQASDKATPGRAERGDAVNRASGKGELRGFLESVAGLSLYGDMPGSVERFLQGAIRAERGYEADWPSLETSSSDAFLKAQALRQRLLRAFTAKGGHLEANGAIKAPLLYPPRADALAGAARYRQVVASQRFDFGKDAFPQTPVTFRYFRPKGQDYAHQDGRPYREGEIVTDRPIDNDPASLTYGVGTAKTLIEDSFNPDYVPLLDFPGM